MNAPNRAPGNGACRLLLARLPMMVAAILLARTASAAGTGIDDELVFDAAFLPAGASSRLDLERFAQADYVAPGTYRGDIRLNGQWQARTDILYREVEGVSRLCLDPASLQAYGIAPDRLRLDPARPPELAWPQAVFCGTIGDIVPDASATFDAGSQTLELQVPQLYLRSEARGHVDPSQWDAGVRAFALSYNANAYHYDSGGASRYSGFVGLNATGRLAGWQLVHQGAMTLGGSQSQRYRSTAAYLQHDIVPWKAQLVLGDTSTPGDLFESVRLQGLRVGSDDRMLPQSQRGFAPVIRGVAETNARVIVRQRGAVLHEASVAPGPFELDDLYPTGYAGDLEVEVREADGRSRRFTVPYSAVPQLLRPGQSRWSISAGRVDESTLRAAPDMLQLQYQRGLSNTLSTYGGVVAGQDYHAGLAGAAINTSFGALAADVSLARTAVQGLPTMSGSSFRLAYNRNVVRTGTSFAVAAYRYATRDYVGLRDWASLRDARARDLDIDTVARQRNRMDLSMNQRLGERGGQLFVIGTRRDFWNAPGRQLDLSIGYSNQWKALSYSLNFQRTRDSIDFGRDHLQDSIPGAIVPELRAQQARVDNRLMLMVSLPLGRSPRAPLGNLMHNRSRNGEPATQLSTNGLYARDDRFSYGATLSRIAGSNSVDLNGGYRGSRGQWSASVSRGSRYSQLGMGATGGMVLHGDGLTFAPPLGDTIALVHAAGAAGARIENGGGARLDKRGYAVVPFLTPYQLNTISIDPKGTGFDVELQETARSVAPRAGSLVRLGFSTRASHGLMVDARTNDDRPLPFGAEATDAEGTPIGVVGQGSRLLLSGLQASGPVQVQWGPGSDEHCVMQVDVPSARSSGEYTVLEARCEMSAAAADSLPAARPRVATLEQAP
ncbi:fimbria/pilus outer membrane usher protein [Stenotrophomonas indicatrix]|uniref:fimbria/pilus outer membrane usher protein n=1 Tax=Stenotrophomonas indicatrix TaxID=2045451 RepID=UPI0008AC0339|nr:fimbria/pilus outer membrane usher protein [Stenotrophomonas indicatrix]SET29703.1 outer membrane usher protein [Stenotrophomonas indicatrix]